MQKLVDMIRFIPFKGIMQPILGSIRSLKFINNRLKETIKFRTICITGLNLQKK